MTIRLIDWKNISCCPQKMCKKEGGGAITLTVCGQLSLKNYPIM
jgi:hypothetical protein